LVTLKIGILAYGSLIGDPGVEIGPLIVRHISVETPFPVEYARLSKTRGYAPTVVPHGFGNNVSAEILVLSGEISPDKARSMLWRRERRQEGSGEEYQEKHFKNAVLVRGITNFCGIDQVLYTDFNPGGKIQSPKPPALAEAAVKSVLGAPPGMDGISYLKDLISKGVYTSLTEQYKEEILNLTQSSDLSEALQKAMINTTCR
jgi:hypothetical protein